MCRCCCKVLKCLDINTNCKAANDAQEAPSPPQDDNAGEDQNSAVGDFAAGKKWTLFKNDRCKWLCFMCHFLKAQGPPPPPPGTS